MHLKVMLLLLTISCNGNDETKVRPAPTSKPEPERGTIPHPSLKGAITKDSAVSDIRKKAEQINRIPFTESLLLENEDFLEQLPDGGASLTGYFYKGELVKISEWTGLSYGVIQRHYYLENGELFYALETEDYFAVDDASGIDPSRFDQTYAGDFYFSDGKLFVNTTRGQGRFKKDRNDPEKEFLTASSFYRDLLLEKKKN